MNFGRRNSSSKLKNGDGFVGLQQYYAVCRDCDRPPRFTVCDRFVGKQQVIVWAS